MLEDVIKESWAFQEMKQKSYKKGFAIGLQAQSLILFIKKYFPSLIQLAEDICHTKQSLEELQDLFRKVTHAKDEEEVHQLLLGVQKQRT